MTRDRGGFPCRYADQGCEYRAYVQSITDQHERHCPHRPDPEHDRAIEETR